MRTSTKWQRFRSHARPFVLANATPSVLPNMRLKLAGDDRSKGTGVLCAGAHELSFNYTARGGRVGPQLKRGPLGGALPPRKHSSVNSFGMVMCGAPRAETHGRAPARRGPTTPRPPHVGRRRARPPVPWLPRSGVPRRGSPAFRGARGALELR